MGFPLGFHDTLHHMPVVRQAAIASSLACVSRARATSSPTPRTHRGTGGAQWWCVARTELPTGDLPWLLLGVHSARLNIGTRDLKLDEALGLKLCVVCGHPD